MENTLREKLLFLIIDKLILALLIGAALLTLQAWSESFLEETKSRLAYERTVAERRSEKLENLWHAVNRYAESVQIFLKSKDSDLKELQGAQDYLWETLSRSGIYLGLTNINEIKDKIRIQLIIDGLLDEQNRASKFEEFDNGVIAVLSDLRELLEKVAFGRNSGDRS